jgi:hypothetical protein
MTAVVSLVLFLVLLMLRRNGRSVRYVGLALVSSAVLLWAISFDFASGKDVVANTAAYRRVLGLSAIGATAALASLIASIWCSDKPVRILSSCIGVVALVLCAADIVVPY